MCCIIFIKPVYITNYSITLYIICFYIISCYSIVSCVTLYYIQAERGMSITKLLLVADRRPFGDRFPKGESPIGDPIAPDF